MTLPVKARVGELIVCAALLAVGAFVVWQASRMRMGSMTLPGPGVLPLAFGIILSAGALGSLVRALLMDDSSVVELGNRPIYLTIGALAGLAILFEPLGAKLSIALFVFAMLTILSDMARWKALLAGAIASAAVWSVFTVLLGVRLPIGVL